MKSVSISAEKRVDLGKKSAKALRSAGKVPCVIYGGESNQHFSATEIAFNNLVYTPNVYAVAIDIEGTIVNALIKEIQFHPVTDRVIHVDFIELIPGKVVNTNIPVITTGNAIGVMNGGKLSKTLRKLSVRAIPENLPDAITIDISPLKIGDKVYVRDLDVEKYDVLTSKNAVIVAVKTARNAIDEEEEEAAAAAAAAAGESTEESTGDTPAVE